MYYILIQQTDSHFPRIFSKIMVESKQANTRAQSDVAITIVPHTVDMYYILIQQTDSHFPRIFSKIMVESKQANTRAQSDVAITIVPHTIESKLIPNCFTE
jgi:hypothetical protein